MLTLVRHGEPERDVVVAERGDPPLSVMGRMHMAEAGRLVEVDGYDAVYCSPLRRARESAEILVPGVDPVIDDDLAEFDRDAEQYLHWEDGAGPYRAYLAGDLSPWGTTLDEFRARIWSVAERMRRDSPGGRVVAVTHGGVINNFFAMLLGSEQVSLFQPAYGSLNRFLYRADEGWTTMELNATAVRPEEALLNS